MRTHLIILILIINCANAWSQTDTTIGIKLTSDHGTDIDAIAGELAIDLNTEKEKANAIYNWVTHNIAYDVNGMWKPGADDADKAKEALKNHKAVCVGYSQLFVALCKSVGLNAVTIDGYAKDMIFDNGDSMYIPRHQWAAVKIAGKWELVDPTWGAGGLYQNSSFLQDLLRKLHLQKKLKAKNLKFRFGYDPQYFMQSPFQFRLRHLPADPLWQLTDTAMPLAVFESGDSAITSFNTAYNTLRQSAPELDKIAEMSPEEKYYDAAGRAYMFNHRYHLALAIRNSIVTDSILNRLDENTTGKDAAVLLKNAGDTMKNALQYIKQQKKGLPEEYSRLNRKNKAKALDARMHIRQIRTDDKRLIAESQKHIRSSVAAAARVRKKGADIISKKKQIDTDKLSDIQEARTLKRPGAAELTAIDDSLTARKDRTDKLNSIIDESNKEIQSLVAGSKLILDSLAASLTIEDSMLRQEAIARIGMQDSYDDEVKKWNGMFRKQKYGITDTLIKFYFQQFNSVSARYDRLIKNHIQVLNIHKSNMRSIEQYKKLAGGSALLTEKYIAEATSYATASDSAISLINSNIEYMRVNKKLFEGLISLAKRQMKVVDYMEAAEKNRSQLEERTLARKKHTDLKENENMRNTAQNAIRKLEKAKREAIQ